MGAPQDARRSVVVDGVGVYLLTALQVTSQLASRVTELPSDDEFVVLLYDSVTDSYRFVAGFGQYAQADQRWVDEATTRGAAVSRDYLGKD